MSLRYQLAQQAETLQLVDMAARQRYWEGLVLMVAGRLGAGIYIMGYCAEMLLKAAYFRVVGEKPGSPVPSMLSSARKWSTRFLPTVPREQYHSVWFWCQLVRRRRRWRGDPLDRTLDNALVRCARRLYTIWWVEARYRPDQARDQHASAVLDDVSWLYRNHVRLWR